MDEAEIFEKINEMLSDSGYPLEISDISDLEDFLNDESNMRFDSYEIIGKYYDELMNESDTDRLMDY